MVMDYCLLALVLAIQSRPLCSTSTKFGYRGVSPSEKPEVGGSDNSSNEPTAHSRRHLSALGLVSSLVDPSDGNSHGTWSNHSSKQLPSTRQRGRFYRPNLASENKYSIDNDRINVNGYNVKSLLESQLDGKWVAQCLNGDKCIKNVATTTTLVFPSGTNNRSSDTQDLTLNYNSAQTNPTPVNVLPVPMKKTVPKESIPSQAIVTNINTSPQDDELNRKLTLDRMAPENHVQHEYQGMAQHGNRMLDTRGTTIDRSNTNGFNNRIDDPTTGNVDLIKDVVLNNNLSQLSTNSSEEIASIELKVTSTASVAESGRRAKSDSEQPNIADNNGDRYNESVNSEEFPFSPFIPVTINLNPSVTNRHYYKRHRTVPNRDIQLTLVAPDIRGKEQNYTVSEVELGRVEQKNRNNDDLCNDENLNLTECKNRWSPIGKLAQKNMEDLSKKYSVGKRDSPYINRVLLAPGVNEKTNYASNSDKQTLETSIDLPSENSNTFLIIGGQWIVHYNTNPTTSEKLAERHFVSSSEMSPSPSGTYEASTPPWDPLMGESSKIEPHNLLIPPPMRSDFDGTPRLSYSYYPPYEQVSDGFHRQQNNGRPCFSNKLVKREENFRTDTFPYETNSPSPIGMLMSIKRNFNDGGILDSMDPSQMNYEKSLINFPSNKVKKYFVNESYVSTTAKQELFKEHDIDPTDMIIIGAQLISPKLHPESKPVDLPNMLAPLPEDETTYRRLAAKSPYARYSQRLYPSSGIYTSIGDRWTGNAFNYPYVQTMGSPRYYVPLQNPSFRATDTFTPPSQWFHQQAQFRDDQPPSHFTNHGPNSYDFVSGQYIKNIPFYEQSFHQEHENGASRDIQCSQPK